MKLFILFSLSIMSAAFASHVDSYSLPLFNSSNEENFSLQSTQMRTQYRIETIERTCTRTEFDGYRNECGFVTEVVCETFPGPHGPGRDPHPGRGHDNGGVNCHPKLVYRCHQEPVYRTVAYSCNQTINVPYEVVDHQVTANLHLNINKDPSLDTDNQECTLKYILDGEFLRTNTECDSALVYSTLLKNSEVDRKGNSTHFYNIDLKVLNAKKILAPVSSGITNMRLEGQNLIFQTGNLANNANFTMKLFVERIRFLKSDLTFIDRPLTKNEFSFEAIDNHSGIVKINLEKLFGGINTSKKHDIKVNIDVIMPAGNLLNSVLPVTNAYGELKLNH